MHGHEFQVLARSEEDAGDWDPSESSKLPKIPTRRDTILVNGNGHAVIRFRSDNPGVWQFHCHIEWHMKQGLMLTIVEVSLITTSQTLKQKNTKMQTQRLHYR